MEYLSGVVERITYANEENGYAVIKIKSAGFPDLVTVVGSLAAVNIGASIKVKGEWKVDSKYGKQFSCIDYRETVPATLAGIEKYLGSGLIKGVGPVNARRIVKYFKEDTIRVIDEEPDRIIEVEGIGPKRVEMIKRGWQEQKEIKNVMLFLQSNGVSTAYAVKIYKTYGNESISIVRENPYRLADDIWGIGFKTADKIAQKLGFDVNSYERCRSGILYVLNELSNDGHCYATTEQLISETVKILELDRELIASTIVRMKQEQSIIADRLDGAGSGNGGSGGGPDRGSGNGGSGGGSYRGSGSGGSGGGPGRGSGSAVSGGGAMSSVATGRALYGNSTANENGAVRAGSVACENDATLKSSTAYERSGAAGDQEALYLPPFYFSEIGTAKRIKEIIASDKSLKSEENWPILSHLSGGSSMRIFSGGSRETISGGSKDIISGGSRETISGGSRDIISGGSRETISGGSRDIISGGSKAIIGADSRDIISGGSKETISGRSRDNISGCSREIISSIEKECGIKYDEVQVEAICAALEAKFMVLTGGPGTGKTTTTLGIIRAFRATGQNVLLAAPTGRAAKRLSEATGMEAKTIHRLLEYKPPEGYKKNAENPLDCDVLIVDETSMVDIILMYNLLKAVRDETTVILVGDVDQLPSVGAGNVLRDIIESGAVKVVRLTRIFRQAQGSAIIMNAHRINHGEYPVLKGGKNSDFFFIEEDEPAKVVETIRELCVKRLRQYYGVDPVRDIQVLCPMLRGETGAHNLNLVLQDCLNKSSEAIRYGGTEYRLNDKVMQIKNNYDKNVFNGDMGSIKHIDQEDRTLVINFDGNDVDYDVTELDEVVLAYATTVHKSQGSEYRIVIAPFTMQHYMMLQRNLLYTCVTRAKKVMVLVGSKKAIGMAVSNNRTQKRNTMLAQRLMN